MSSLCDSCFAPGYCCRRLNFFGGKGEQTYWLDEPIEPQLRSGMSKDTDRPVPFRIAKVREQYTDKESGRPYGHVDFSCVNLTPEGRCGDYENRPWLCRHFEPASGNICVHYKGAEAGADG